MASGHHGDSWTNKPTNRDGRGSGLISPLHNADKTSPGSPIGKNLYETFYFQIYFLNARHAYIFMWNTSGKRKKIIDFF